MLARPKRNKTYTRVSMLCSKFEVRVTHNVDESTYGVVSDMAVKIEAKINFHYSY